MRTMTDLVLEHAEKYKGLGTSEGLEMLEMEHHPRNYGAANTYCAAISTIQKLQKKIEELEKQLAYWENK